MIRITVAASSSDIAVLRVAQLLDYLGNGGAESAQPTTSITGDATSELDAISARDLRPGIAAARDWVDLDAVLASVQRSYERGHLNQQEAEELSLYAAEVSRVRPPILAGIKTETLTLSEGLKP